LFASLSFYPGQSQFFSRELRDTNLLYVPHVLLFGSMIFWMYRVSVRRRLPQSDAIGAAHHEAMTTVVPRSGAELIPNR